MSIKINVVLSYHIMYICMYQSTLRILPIHLILHGEQHTSSTLAIGDFFLSEYCRILYVCNCKGEREYRKVRNQVNNGLEGTTYRANFFDLLRLHLLRALLTCYMLQLLLLVRVNE